MSAGRHAAPTEILACLIIDDPLLRPRYGALDYATLLREMRAHRFFSEIAFIPWNYRRSDPGTVRLLAANPDHYALCVHGCNHTKSEFGGTDYAELHALAATALWRMEEHALITGLPYDPVMVFPQGLFSSVAMRALKKSGYVAAFNSRLEATDCSAPPADERRQPASMAYEDLPLFLRRHPADRAGFLDDVAHGRPVLAVLHQGALREGYEPLTDFVDWVNGLGHVTWASLSSIVEHVGIEVSRAKVPPCRSRSPLRTVPRVMARRLLCEFRDEYLDRSPLLTRAYGTLRRSPA